MTTIEARKCPRGWRRTAAGALLALAVGCGEDIELKSTDGTGGSAASVGAGGGTGGGRSPGPSQGGGGDFTFVVPDGGTDATGPLPIQPTADKNCGLKKFDLQRLPAEMLLVFDRSGSMLQTSRVQNRVVQRWPEAVAALDQVINRTQGGVFWGVKMYPSDALCGVTDGVNAPVAPNNHAAAMMVINGNPPVQDRGATPTSVAMQKAVAYMKTRQGPNPKYILLATDGLPNCRNNVHNRTDAAGAVAAVAAAAQQGLPTFVVGIATVGSDAHGTLNQMAVQGQRPRNDPNTRYYPAVGREELVAALEAITGQITSCTFNLEMPPPAPDAVAVDVDGARVNRDPVNGWDYGSGNRTIVLGGMLCERLKSGAAKNVQITYGCPGQLIP